MTRRTTKLIALFACIHGFLSMTLLLLAFTASSHHFDIGTPQTTSDRVIAEAVDVLFLPATLVWTKCASENLPNAALWLVFAANSILWGSVFVLGVLRLRRHVHIE